MKIHLPNSAWIGNIEPFLKSLDLSDRGTFEVTSHKDWFSVHPVVLSMLVVLGLRLKQDGGKYHFNIAKKPAPYLEVMDVFKILKIRSPLQTTRHEPSGRYVPVTVIKSQSDLDEFLTKLTPLLHRGPEASKAIRYVIAELVRNVIEHARSSDGAVVCAQYYKKSNTVRIGVVDCGVGIPATIGRIYPNSNDLRSILLALTPGVTSGTGENAGAGLFIIRCIAKVSRSFIMVYSGKAMYKLLKTTKGEKVKLNADPLKDRHSVATDLPDWKGTAVGIDICLNQKEDFDQLLSEVKKVYREKNKGTGTSFKRPRFI